MCRTNGAPANLSCIDCGQLTGDALQTTDQELGDSTGDPYEDYPEDQAGMDDVKAALVLKIATELKEYGTKAFKASDPALALDKYQKALRYLNEYPSALKDDPADTETKLNALRFSLHNNCALMHYKLKDYKSARISATNALEVKDSSNADKAKARFRRAQALIGEKDEEEAVKDLEEALKLAPGDTAITKELNGVKVKVKDAQRKEKAAMKKFFS